jgi:hypothetical protein
LFCEGSRLKCDGHTLVLFSPASRLFGETDAGNDIGLVDETNGSTFEMDLDKAFISHIQAIIETGARWWAMLSDTCDNQRAIHQVQLTGQRGWRSQDRRVLFRVLDADDRGFIIEADFVWQMTPHNHEGGGMIQDVEGFFLPPGTLRVMADKERSEYPPFWIHPQRNLLTFLRNLQ